MVIHDSVSNLRAVALSRGWTFNDHRRVGLQNGNNFECARRLTCTENALTCFWGFQGSAMFCVYGRFVNCSFYQNKIYSCCYFVLIGTLCVCVRCFSLVKFRPALTGVSFNFIANNFGAYRRCPITAAATPASACAFFFISSSFFVFIYCIISAHAMLLLLCAHAQSLVHLVIVLQHIFPDFRQLAEPLL